MSEINLERRRVIIIGSGPAGLTAAIYTARAGLQPVIYMGNEPGGQLMGTGRVENWPGELGIPGPDLMEKLETHAKYYGAEIIRERVIRVSPLEHKNLQDNLQIKNMVYTVESSSGKQLETESVIIATGSTHRLLNCPGEQRYWGHGVAVCATCDAPFYKNKSVVIVGGGNSSVTHAETLARFANKVTIIHIGDKLTATDPIKDLVLANPKINIIYNHSVTEIFGTGEGDTRKVTHVEISKFQNGKLDRENPEKQEIQTDGVFIAIGFEPNTRLFASMLDQNEWGYFICTPGSTQTSMPGIFAAGDVMDHTYRQAVTSAGFGCMAALDCEYYLTGQVKVVYSQ